MFKIGDEIVIKKRSIEEMATPGGLEWARDTTRFIKEQTVLEVTGVWDGSVTIGVSHWTYKFADIEYHCPSLENE